MDSELDSLRRKEREKQLEYKMLEGMSNKELLAAARPAFES